MYLYTFVCVRVCVSFIPKINSSWSDRRANRTVKPWVLINFSSNIIIIGIIVVIITLDSIGCCLKIAATTVQERGLLMKHQAPGHNVFCRGKTAPLRSFLSRSLSPRQRSSSSSSTFGEGIFRTFTLNSTPHEVDCFVGRTVSILRGFHGGFLKEQSTEHNIVQSG